MATPTGWGKILYAIHYYITSIPNYHNAVMHYHPIVNDRLLMFRKLNWIQNVKVQMYKEDWKRKHA